MRSRRNVHVAIALAGLFSVLALLSLREEAPLLGFEDEVARRLAVFEDDEGEDYGPDFGPDVARRLSAPADGAVRIVHAINLYAPLDGDRRLVLESMERARSNADCVGGEIEVEHVAAVHPGDVHVVPESFDGSYALTRYYEGRYPLLQDIFDGALGGYDFDFMIFTNADIVLHPYFYCTVRDAILLQGHDAFAINRKTVPEDTTLEEIAAGRVRDPVQHPGHDCWVMSRDVWSGFNLGSTFLGYPRFSREMLLNMLHFAEYPRVYHSFEVVNGTYHRGDERAWKARKNKVSKEHVTANIINSLCGDNNYHLICEAPKDKMVYHWCKSLRGYKNYDVRKWCTGNRKIMGFK